MTPARDIVWVPASLGARLAAELQALLDDWTRTWGLPAADAPQAQAWDAGSPALPPDVIDLLAPASASWRDALALALLHVQGESRVADGVVRRVVASLQAAVHAALGTAPQPPTALPMAAAMATVGAPGPGHGGLALRVMLLGCRCGLAVTSEQLRRSGRLPPPPRLALPAVAFERALAAVPVPLVAQLGHARLSARELLELAPGDVLVLETGLASPLSLISPGSPLRLTAQLGATTDATHRAARCLPPH